MKKKGFAKFAEFLQMHIVAIVVIAAVIAGSVAMYKIITEDKDSQSGGTSSTDVYEDADEIYLAMYNPRSFNVYASSDEDIIYLNNIIYGSLFKLDSTLNIKPDLVSTYSTDTEAGTVTISLRGDAFFSDGTAVSSYDVRQSVREIKQVGSSSPYYAYASKIDSVEISDDRNFTIYFSSPADASLDNLVFPIISYDLYETGEDFAIGTGPYAYSTYSEEEGYLKLVPNEYYYGGKPKLPITVKITSDKSHIPGFITMNSVTAFLYKDSDGAVIAEDRSLYSEQVVSSELEYVGFNCSKGLLSDSRMRRAIAKSVDVSRIIEEDYGGAGTASDSVYFPNFLGAAENHDLEYKPNEAEDLLNEMGLVDSDRDGVRENSDGTPITLTIIVNSDNVSRKDAADLIAKSLEEMGITVVVNALSQAEFDAALKAGNFDMFIYGYRFDKQFNLSVLFSSGNYAKYSDAETDSLLAALETALTPEQQRTAFESLKAKINSDAPYFPICYKNYTFMAVDTFQSSGSPLYFDPYRSCSTWSWKQKISTDDTSTTDQGTDTTDSSTQGSNG
ncbi:MAG: ABC transporter substrate-binding protein [Eubacterium sp.]